MSAGWRSILPWFSNRTSSPVVPERPPGGPSQVHKGLTDVPSVIRKAVVARGPLAGALIGQRVGISGPQAFQQNAFQDGFQKGPASYVDPLTVPGLMVGRVVRDKGTLARA